MTTLIVGASGATGRLLVEELLNRGERVKIIIRTENNLPLAINNHENLSITRATILQLSGDEISHLAKGCDAVVSCLDHNLTWKGIYGSPRRLVSDATSRLCLAIKPISQKPQLNLY